MLSSALFKSEWPMIQGSTEKTEASHVLPMVVHGNIRGKEESRGKSD